MKTRTKSKKASKILAPFFDKTGRKKGEVVLPNDVFGVKSNEHIIAQYVRVYLSHQRNAHAKTKSRGEINASKAKIYRQKGTGRARHGARSAPIFVGGGVAHGPSGLENYRLSIPKKIIKKAFLSALSYKAKEGKILVAELEEIEPKTKNFLAFAEKVLPAIDDTLLVHAGERNLILASRNVAGLRLSFASQLNAYEILSSDTLLLTKQALETLNNRYLPKEAE